MSSSSTDIGAPNDSLSIDGTRRYHVTCRVWLHSHNRTDTLDVSQDVIEFSTSKTIKGMGSASIALTASRNYLNEIYPNDYINIYVDLGDGNGFTHLFFGLVDRIEESQDVTPAGETTTLYHIGCSDFQKIVEATQIYLNFHLKDRQDIVSEAVGVASIGGSTLRMMGLKVFGTPADLLVNILVVLLGFASQFMFPENMNVSLDAKNIQNMIDYLESEKGKSAKGGIISALGEEAYRGLIDGDSTEIETIVRSFVEGNEGEFDDQEDAVAEEAAFSLAAAGVNAITGLLDKQTEDVQVDSSNPNARRVTRFSARPIGFLDLLDMFNFIEHGAIDGYLNEFNIWDASGSLAQIIRSVSNEAINELIYDLRPVTYDDEGDDTLVYSREEDFIGGNVSERTNGIKYVPAVVMREHPFGTVQNIGLDAELSLNDKDGNRFKVKDVAIGSIFSDNPNAPGRHKVGIPTISATEKMVGGPPVAFKTMDVAVISEQQIRKSSLGRSDADHFNLIEFYSDDILGSSMRYYMQDILPIITPIQVLRHGLRVRTINTRFARLSLGAAEQAVPAVTVEEPEEEEEEISSDVGTPLEGGRASPPYWRYRGNRFHHGVDIYQADEGAGESVLSIADGEIVASAPVFCRGFGGYGNCVIIKHSQFLRTNDDGDQVPVYSLYAHMATRSHPGTVPTSEFKKACCSIDLINGGSLSPIKVKKGDVLGTVGSTRGSRDADGNKKSETFAGGSKPHLHFEILILQPDGALYPAKLGTGVTADGKRDKESGFSNLTPLGGSGTPPESSSRSQDPVAFLSSKGVSLSGTTEEPADDDDDQDTDDADTQQGDGKTEEERQDEDLPTTEPSKVTITTVDSPAIRVQIIRWALLLDHWFQHNLEYLSGRLDLSPSPEIRVGYRLDIFERNMSFYVEGVNQSWTGVDGGTMNTSLTVTRGQPQNKFPLYVLPNNSQLGVPKDQRATDNSRLAKYFLVPDPLAVRRAVVVRSDPGREGFRGLPAAATTANSLDEIEGEDLEGVQVGGIFEPSAEFVEPAVTDAGSLALAGATDDDDALTVEDALSAALASLDEALGL